MKENILTLYLDDSGTRHPNRTSAQLPTHGRDWFGLGGIILPDAEREEFKKKHAALVEKWSINKPLHSSEIRNCSHNFKWLGKVEAAKRQEFLQDIQALVTSPCLTAIACVKNKSSVPMQVADICLWPMCIGGYDRKNLAFSALRDANILIDCKVPQSEIAERGIKYSCWERVQ